MFDVQIFSESYVGEQKYYTENGSQKHGFNRKEEMRFRTGPAGTGAPVGSRTGLGSRFGLGHSKHVQIKLIISRSSKTQI